MHPWSLSPMHPWSLSPMHRRQRRPLEPPLLTRPTSSRRPSYLHQASHRPTRRSRSSPSSREPVAPLRQPTYVYVPSPPTTFGAVRADAGPCTAAAVQPYGPMYSRTAGHGGLAHPSTQDRPSTAHRPSVSRSRSVHYLLVGNFLASVHCMLRCLCLCTATVHCVASACYGMAPPVKKGVSIFSRNFCPNHSMAQHIVGDFSSSCFAFFNKWRQER
eukprot:COSAG01_NODE_7675_length_3103_cov_7.624168_2_plen_216_part_00